jgi:fumarate hydratase class II
MMQRQYRTERDSMGELQVPADALYGAQTQRAVDNFPISGRALPFEIIRAIALIKRACAQVNKELDLLDPDVADAIRAATDRICAGGMEGHFPVDVFQTGSGTSTNMNANEVIARIASESAGKTVHPNDHVNMGQSSNDVFPTAIHVAACLALREGWLPAFEHLATTIEQRAQELDDAVKTGRTHLMDAMPVTLGQELSGWAAQVREAIERVRSSLPRLERLAQGGTAVGGRLRRAGRRGAALVNRRALRHGGQLLRPPEQSGRCGRDERPAQNGRHRGAQDRQ